MCCLSKKTYDETRPSDHRSRDTNQTSEEVMTRQNVYTYQTSCHCTDVPICPHKVAVLILSIPPSFSQPPWQQLLWILPLLHLPAAASSTHRQTSALRVTANRQECEVKGHRRVQTVTLMQLFRI